MSDTNVVQSPRTEVERMLNLPEVVETRSLGKIEIREIPVEKFFEIGIGLMDVLRRKAQTGDPSSFLLTMAKSPETFTILRDILSAATGRAAKDFVGIGPIDLMKLLLALKRVLNWEELTELFFQLVPRQALLGLQKSIAERTVLLKQTMAEEKSPS